MPRTQITTGVIEGVATDATGAALPGVNVEARNVDTNFTRSAVTGRRRPLRRCCSCRPAATRSRSRWPASPRCRRTNIELTVGQTVTLGAPMRCRASPKPSPSRSRRRRGHADGRPPARSNQMAVEYTPILGRKFEDLLTLTPGVSIVQGPDGDEITFAGQRGIFNNISLDGGDYNNGFFGEQAGGQRAAIDITLEAVARIPGRSRPARRPSSAAPPAAWSTSITKSGTNQSHGGLFHFQRLEALTGDLSDGTPLERLPSRAVRRHVRRPDQEGQDVLLRRPRGHHGELRASEPEPAGRRHRVPGPGADRSAPTRR